MAAHGGKRQGAGRKAGSQTEKTRDIAMRAAKEGLTPIEFMLQILRQEPILPDHPTAQEILDYKNAQSMRFEAAKAAAPYCHPRLANVAAEVSGKDGGNLIVEIVRHGAHTPAE